MNPSDKDMLLQQYLDGELAAAEREAFEHLLGNDPGLRSELEALRALGDTLRKQFPAEQEPPSPDFFNAHILRQIEREEIEQRRSETPASVRGRSAAAGRFSWPILPWAIAAASLVAALFLGLRDPGRAGAGAGLAMSGVSGRSMVGTTYTPGEGVRADAFFSRDAGATVIRLAGLEEIPADRELAGHAAVDHRPGKDGKPIEFRDGSGQLLLSMITGVAGSSPRFF